MSSLFSLKMWWIFFLRLLKVIYPAELVLLPFAYKSFKLIKTSPYMRFMIVFLICDLGARAVIFFAGVPFSQRYFYPFAVIVAIFATSGIIPFVDILSVKVLKRTSEMQKFNLYFFLIIVIGLSYSMKALRPRNDKPWLQAISSVIKQLSPPNTTPVIICNHLDERFGYYAGTTEMYQLYPSKDWLLMKRVKTENDSRWVPFDNKRGIKNLSAKIAKMNPERVFIILRVGKDGNSESNTQLTENLPGINLVGRFTDRKKRIFKLYTIKRVNYPKKRSS